MSRDDEVYDMIARMVAVGRAPPAENPYVAADAHRWVWLWDVAARWSGPAMTAGAWRRVIARLERDGRIIVRRFRGIGTEVTVNPLR